MIENIICVVTGFMLGLYTGHQRLRKEVNKFLGKILKLSGKLEFRNNKREEREDPRAFKDNLKSFKDKYHNWSNTGVYCVLPGLKNLACKFDGYCGDCPVYKDVLEGLLHDGEDSKENPKPVGLDEEYWWKE